eukprot:UN5032
MSLSPSSTANLIFGLLISGISSCLTSLNFWVTILNLRSYCLTLKTMPLFPWALLITAAMLLLTLPVLSGAFLMVLADLHSNTLLLSNAAVSLGGAFVSLEISSQFLIFFSLFSFVLAWTFISLQIKEFQIMGLSINDSVYSCLFFFLTGLHFFHLLLGLFLLGLFFWGCSFP